MKGLHDAVPDCNHDGFCDACFTGDYVVDIPPAMAKKSFLTKRELFEETYAAGQDADVVNS